MTVVRRDPHRFAISALPMAAFVLLLSSFASAGATHAIPPGQELLVAEMLGRDEAVGPCRLIGVDMSPATVQASYGCVGDGGTIGILLEYPSPGVAAAFTTRKFAVSTRGGAPPELLDALRRRIVAREGSWQWTDVGDARFVEPSSSQPPPANALRPEAPRGRLWLAPAASCAAMLLLVVVSMARRRVDKSRSRGLR